ncbi:MAG: FAD-binding oxidoreductase [Oscillospiraceae bacterium]
MSDKTLWTGINKVYHQYNWLAQDEECDVCVLGGSITAALCANEFQKKGIDTILVSETPLGYMSTAIAGSVLRFGNANSLSKLSKKIGKDNAVSFFNECVVALNEIEELEEEIGGFRFARRDGICYTKNPLHVDELHTEYLMCKNNGFDVSFLEKTDASDKLRFAIECATRLGSLDGEVDGYALIHRLSSNAKKNGARIYENTVIDNINTKADGVVLVTQYGKVIRCKKLILAIGYKQNEYLNALEDIKTTFTIATRPLENLNEFINHDIISRYKTDIYARTTHDDRILMGGLDAAIIAHNTRWGKVLNPKKIIDTKYQELETAMNLMFSGIMNLEVVNKFNGVYGNTFDNLPVCGECAGYSNILFNMQSGANPILSAQICAKLLVDIYEDNQNKMSNLFSCERKTL